MPRLGPDGTLVEQLTSPLAWPHHTTPMCKSFFLNLGSVLTSSNLPPEHLRHALRRFDRPPAAEAPPQGLEGRAGEAASVTGPSCQKDETNVCMLYEARNREMVCEVGFAVIVTYLWSVAKMNETSLK
ncbi:unnamed protein product, partial [Phaeothamnion confervicola]